MVRGFVSQSSPRWARYSDQRLLDLRLSELDLTLAGTWLEERIERLHDELSRRGLRFRPHCWLSDEWFSPHGIPGIAIPFYLAHPRLMRLEKRQMYEVEGGTRATCMQLLRHEAGHAIETAFRLGRRARWRQIFGRAGAPYPEYYRPRPFSRAYVLHLDWWYAQSHPTEDFAETFAVWLKPHSQWRRRYAGWPALAKLNYVHTLMEELAGRRPPVRSRARIDPVHRLPRTLREHYAARKARYERDYSDVYRRDLRRLFSDAPEDRSQPAASVFLRRYGPELRDRIAAWTGEYAYTINLVLKDMIAQVREMKLRVARPAEELKMELAIFLTMQTMNYLYSKDHRIAL